MDQLDDSSHVQVNADDDRENDSGGESSGDEELCGDELRDDARSDDVLSGDERSGDELRDDVRSEDMRSGDEQFRDEQVGDGQDEHSDSHSWSSCRDLSLKYEQHLIEAAEKILRQTPKNSIDVLVLYRRLLRYRRLRMLPRAVACALAMQMRDEQKETLRSDIPDIRFNINRLSEKDCIDRIRFGKVQLAYLLMQFRIPPFFSTEEGYRVSSIEALCITFERMGCPSRWREQVQKFGRSESNLSSIFYHVCEHITARCAPLLRGDWDRVSTRLEDFASAIQAKGAALDNVWGFTDGTVRNICRPGDTTEQRAMYNGHKRSHAVKYQAVTTPDGIIVHMFGPGQGRAHDLTLLDGSALEEIISRDHRFRGYLLYGDPAYGHTYVFASPFDKVGATSEELVVNKSLSSVRIAVEWGFGQIISEWALLDFKRKMSIGNVPVGMLYEVTAIFANCVTIARHQNVISSYFDVPPPTFAEYFATLD
ncbi:hypothetical protein PF007_g17964 [Phytophthora fragariae]|nr:hypothetical protein PF007_g17964 [Phytophthora fragariae]KAE9116127.1 hypothetical protein PF006_g19115 [Phytophthora fragariae]